MDIQFSVSDLTAMPMDQWPPELQTYTTDLASLCVTRFFPFRQILKEYFASQSAIHRVRCRAARYPANHQVGQHRLCTVLQLERAPKYRLCRSLRLQCSR